MIRHKKQTVEHSKNITKSGRPALPQRPFAKIGSRTENEWARQCIQILQEWRKQGNKLTLEELEILHSRYKLIGDTISAEKVKKGIEKRKGS